jgi:hypothetical protein
MLLHYSGIVTKGYGCNGVRGQFTFDDAKRSRAELSAAIQIAGAAKDLSEALTYRETPAGPR